MERADIHILNAKAQRTQSFLMQTPGYLPRKDTEEAKASNNKSENYELDRHNSIHIFNAKMKFIIH
jgi:hypothetical protein